MQTSFTRALELRHPIDQAPMAGANATPPELVAAVSESGALGFLGAAYMSGDEIARNCRDIRMKTNRPFGINLFVPTTLAPEPGVGSNAWKLIAAYHVELGIPAPATRVAPRSNFDEQFEVVMSESPRVFSSTFGALSADRVGRLKERGTFVMGTATTVAEAVELERGWVDAIVAQGSEAGAHRGSFAAPFEESMVGTMALVPQMVDAVKVPLLASGGIMDGRAIVAANPGKARTTRAFSGRPAGGIVNRVMREVDSSMEPDSILPFPYQNDLTRAMRTAAANQRRIEFLSLWAGQRAPLARRWPVRELLSSLVTEMETTRGRLTGLADT